MGRNMSLCEDSYNRKAVYGSVRTLGEWVGTRALAEARRSSERERLKYY